MQGNRESGGAPWAVSPGQMAPVAPPTPPTPPVEAAAAASTGHPAVDEAVLAVARAQGLDPADQIPVYQAAYRTLQETLASVDL
jgi:hypothetical protein